MPIGTPVGLGSASSTSTGTNHFTITTSGAVPAGALMVMSSGTVTIATGVNVISVVATDGINTNNFVPAIQVVNLYETIFEDLWYCPNALPLNTSATVTINYGNSLGFSGSGVAAGVCYVTGLAGINPFDSNADNTAGYTFSSTQAVPVTTLGSSLYSSHEILFGSTTAISSSGALSFTDDGAFTNLYNASLQTNTIYWGFSYRIVSNNSPVTYDPTITYTGGVSVSAGLNIAPFSDTPIGVARPFATSGAPFVSM